MLDVPRVEASDCLPKGFQARRHARMGIHAVFHHCEQQMRGSALDQKSLLANGDIRLLPQPCGNENQI